MWQDFLEASAFLREPLLSTCADDQVLPAQVRYSVVCCAPATLASYPPGPSDDVFQPLGCCAIRRGVEPRSARVVRTGPPAAYDQAPPGELICLPGLFRWLGI